MVVQDITWYKHDTQPSDDYTFSYGNEKANHPLEAGFFIHKEII
jgi:hypothetical protein